MQKRVKKTTKYLLTMIPFLLFIIASIVVLVLAQGKTITDTGKLIESSIIRINAYPLNPTVTVNGSPVSLSDGKTVNVNPGKNVVKVTKDGYYDWEKEVINYAGIIKEIYVQMYPKAIAFDKLSKTQIDFATFSADRQYIYTLRKSSQNLEIYRSKIVRGIFEFNASTNEELLSTVPRKDISANEFEILNFEVNANNSFALLETNSTDISQFHLINFSTDAVQALDVLIGIEPNKVDLSNNSQSLIFTGEGITGEYNYNTNAKYLISSDELSEYFIRSNNVIFSERGAVQTYTEGITKELEKFSKLIEPSIGPDFKLVNVSLDGNIFIYKNNGNLVWFDITNNYKTLLDSELEIVEISADNKLIILKKDSLHFTFNFEKNVIDSKSYNLLVSEIDLSAYNIAKFQIINGDKNIAVFTDSGKLLIMDFDGKNLKDILPDFSFAKNEIFIINNAEMYGVIEEILSEESSVLGNFIYKFNLESIKK